MYNIFIAALNQYSYMFHHIFVQILIESQIKLNLEKNIDYWLSLIRSFFAAFSSVSFRNLKKTVE